MLTYSTDRVVLIPNKCLALTWWIINLAILGYIVGYALIWAKGYQQKSLVEGVVVTKVKGVMSTESLSDSQLGVLFPQFYRRVWDANDIVSPAHGGEAGGFFVLTNVIITPNQTRGICPESEDVAGAKCTADSGCPRGRALPIGNGYMTGRCVLKGQGQGVKTKTCEISGWCPVESHQKPLGGKQALLVDTQDFTVLVKNSIEFPGFGGSYKRRNILNNATTEELQKCIYHPRLNPFCPTFALRDIVGGAGENYADVALTGAVFALQINWNCDFDWGKGIEHCLPKYSFARLDNPKAAISPGFNFRSTVYHEENRRTLTQNFGIKFLIRIEGEGKKFDSVKFVLAVGASIGLFALATVICDLIFKFICVLQKWVKWKWLHFYKEHMKYDSSWVKGQGQGQGHQGSTQDAKASMELIKQV